MSGVRWTESQWAAYVASKDGQLGLKEAIAPLLSAPLSASDELSSNPKKRKGVDVKPIVASLKTAQSHIHWDAERSTLTLWFGGARVLTVNELFSIMQYRKHDTFAYKKEWKLLIERTLSLLPLPVLRTIHFSHGCHVSLFRAGKRALDLDALPVVFKFALDALKINQIHSILADDNPNVVASIQTWQVTTTATPALALRLEYRPEENTKSCPPLHAWLGQQWKPPGDWSSVLAASSVIEAPQN